MAGVCLLEKAYLEFVVLFNLGIIGLVALQAIDIKLTCEDKLERKKNLENVQITIHATISYQKFHNVITHLQSACKHWF